MEPPAACCVDVQEVLAVKAAHFGQCHAASIVHTNLLTLNFGIFLLENWAKGLLNIWIPLLKISSKTSGETGVH
jgi:hypothetical protein